LLSNQTVPINKTVKFLIESKEALIKSSISNYSTSRLLHASIRGYSDF